MPAILPFLTKTRMGVALIVAVALGSIIITQYLSIKGYEDRLSKKTEDAAACQVSKAVAEADTAKIESELAGVREQLKTAQAKAEAAQVRAKASAEKEISKADQRAGAEMEREVTEEEMTSWYESVWQ